MAQIPFVRCDQKLVIFGQTFVSFDQILSCVLLLSLASACVSIHVYVLLNSILHCILNNQGEGDECEELQSTSCYIPIPVPEQQQGSGSYKLEKESGPVPDFDTSSLAHSLSSAYGLVDYRRKSELLTSLTSTTTTGYEPQTIPAQCYYHDTLQASRWSETGSAALERDVGRFSMELRELDATTKHLLEHDMESNITAPMSARVVGTTQHHGSTLLSARTAAKEATEHVGHPPVHVVSVQEAATRVQALYRGHRCRERVKVLRRLHSAARTIQATWQVPYYQGL